MVHHEETVLVSIYDGKPVNIEIPRGVYVYLIELDTTQCSWGDFVDIYILTDDDIIYYGPLEKNFKQFNLTNWVSKGESIKFQFRLNNNLKVKTKRWFIVNDSIKIRIKGYHSAASVDFDENWKDMEFQEEWA